MPLAPSKNVTNNPITHFSPTSYRSRRLSRSFLPSSIFVRRLSSRIPCILWHSSLVTKCSSVTFFENLYAKLQLFISHNYFLPYSIVFARVIMVLCRAPVLFLSQYIDEVRQHQCDHDEYPGYHVIGIVHHLSGRGRGRKGNERPRPVRWCYLMRPACGRGRPRPR